MSLSGSLDVFPLTEVFRLLDRTGRSGQLSVETPASRGRIFFDGGALTFATNVDDSELRRRLIAAGLLAPDGVSDLRVAIASAPAEDLAPFVEEHTVESLYRISTTGHGFVFHLDERAPFESGRRFDTKEIVSEAERRATAWAEIEAVVPDLDAPLTMNPDLSGRTEVVLAASSWRLITRLDGGRSVRELARVTGSTEFHVASLVADLTRNGLVEVGASAPTVTQVEAPVHDGWWSEPEATATDTDADQAHDETIDGDNALADLFDAPDESDDDANVTSFARGAIRRRLVRDEAVEHAAVSDTEV